MTRPRTALDDPSIAHAVEVLWNYHDLHHELEPSDVGIGLGSHDLGVATTTADLYHRGLFPLIVFTGANSPTTRDRFPRGEAVHYRERAIELGVPPDVILTEGTATNTGENITATRALLADRAIRRVTLISRPYQQRRAFATCRKLWPAHPHLRRAGLRHRAVHARGRRRRHASADRRRLHRPAPLVGIESHAVRVAERRATTRGPRSARGS